MLPPDAASVEMEGSCMFYVDAMRACLSWQSRATGELLMEAMRLSLLSQLKRKIPCRMSFSLGVTCQSPY